MANKRKEIPKDALITLYLDEKKTCKEIGVIYETTQNTVKANLLRLGIPVRSAKESHVLALDKYGAPKPKGTLPWNKGVPRTPKEKKKMSDTRKIRLANGAIIHPNLGKHLALETRQKISHSNKARESILWSNLNHKTKQLRSLFAGKKPTPHETKLAKLIEKFSLPFRWNGNGGLMLGFSVPDFAGIDLACLLEIHDDSRSKSYREERTQLFASYGYRTLFFYNGEVESPNWETICLAKIKEFIGR